MATGSAGGNGDAEFGRRLSIEVGGWEGEGLISSEQAAEILRRYEPSASGPPSGEPDTGVGGSTISPVDAAERTTLVSRAVSIIGVMGALLVGLGIIIYVAANWDVIPVWARITMLVGLTAAINAAGWTLLAKFEYPRIGVAMLVLGALAYGAAIHLIAQIYHVPVNHPNLTTAWFLGALPMGYIARSRLVVGFSLALLVLSMGFRTQWWLEYYGADTLLYLAPLTLALSAAVVALGLLQLRFTWTRPLAPYCYYPGLAIGLAAFAAMTVASIGVDVGNLTWAVLSAEYWVTAGVGIATAAGAASVLWWNSRAQPDTRPVADVALAATMVVTAACIWGWFAYPAAVLWWLFNLVAFGGVALVALFKRSAVLLGGVALLFVILVAMRFVSLADLDGAATPILLAAAALTVAACVYSGSLVMRVMPLVTPYDRIVAAVGLGLAASSLHVMGYGAFWRWETPLVWSWMPVEYWFAMVIGWILAASLTSFVLWKHRRSGEGDALWPLGTVGAMAALTLAMWFALGYQISAAWSLFNLALLAGIAALICYAYRRRQRSVAYFAGSVFAFSLVVRCLAAIAILAENELLLWLGPVGLGVAGIVFLTGRLQVRWSGTATTELRTNSRVWDLAGLAGAIASVYAMSYSDPWAFAVVATEGSAMAFLREYWFLAATAWGAAILVGIVIWVVDRRQSSPAPASPGQLRWETSAAAVMALLALVAWLGLLLGWTWTWLPLNAALLGTVLALVAAGYRWNRGDLINLAVVAFGITLFTRYFEFGFGLLGQSLAFIVAGAIMLGMGFGLEFLRRRMLRGVRIVGEPA
jgi:uncharacterized membrane protein